MTRFETKLILNKLGVYQKSWDKSVNREEALQIILLSTFEERSHYT